LGTGQIENRSSSFESLARILSFISIILITLFVTSFLILPFGLNPLVVFWELIKSGLGSLKALTYSINIMTPIFFAGIAALFAFRSGVWNIGQEGQLLMGAVGATFIGVSISGIPSFLHLVMIFIASVLCGSIWAAIPGILKVKFKANEIITTLLMNFIAIGLTSYLVNHPMRGADAVGPRSDMIGATAKLPSFTIGGWQTPHVGILIAIVVAIAVSFILKRTVLGYRVKSVGVNPETAYYGGIPTSKIVVTSMFISGGIAGLAGMSQVSGVVYLLTAEGISFNYGYFGILVALIGKLNIRGVAVAAFVIGVLLNGGRSIQTTLDISSTMVIITIAIFTLSLLLREPIERGIMARIMKKKG
jgi:ABC-type uncharacterized transport system permease subunit